jgi:hypothetical protein
MTLMTKEQIMEQKIERLRSNLMDVFKAQRKKDEKGGRGVLESNACMLTALALVTADIIVSVTPREIIEGYQNVYENEVRDCIREILRKEAQ